MLSTNSITSSTSPAVSGNDQSLKWAPASDYPLILLNNPLPPAALADLRDHHENHAYHDAQRAMISA